MPPSPNSADFRLTDAQGIQDAIDNIDRGAGPYRAAILLPPGLIALDRPLWLDRSGVQLVGSYGTRLRSGAAWNPVHLGLKRVSADFEKAHTVPQNPGFGWNFNGDSYLLLKDTPFDLGPWKGDSPQNSRLVNWDNVRTLRIRLEVVAGGDPDSPVQWRRQAILTTLGAFDATEPDPLRLTCPSDGRLAVEAKTREGADIYLEWDAPATPATSLDLTLGLDKGITTFVQNGSPVNFRRWQLAVGCHLRHSEAAEFCVARGIPQPFNHGTFTLRSLRIDADDRLLGRLDRLPLASGFQGLWKWTGDANAWGYGLLRPVNFGPSDTVDGLALRNLRLSVLDGYPYGCGALMGLGTHFDAVDVIFEHGARGFDQCRMIISYPMNFHRCRFEGHHHCGLNSDYSILTVRDCSFQGYGPRYFLRSRASTATVEGCFFAESGEGLISAVRHAEANSSRYARNVADMETPEIAPDHLYHFSLGRTNGGITPIRVEDSQGACAKRAFVRLDDPWGGKGGKGVGPGALVLDNSFRSYGDKAPCVLEYSGNWAYETRGPQPVVPMTTG